MPAERIPYAQWIEREPADALYADDEGQESLHGDIDGALDALHDRDYEDEQAGKADPDDEFELLVYERMAFDEKFAERQADKLVDHFICGEIDEEYGDPDGVHETFAPEVVKTLTEKIAAAIAEALKKASPWACEPTGQVVVITRAELRKLRGGA